MRVKTQKQMTDDWWRRRERYRIKYWFEDNGDLVVAVVVVAALIAVGLKYGWWQ